MHVVICPRGARLVEAADVRAFDVRIDPALDAAALAAVLDGVGEHAPLGEHPGGHVHVRRDWLLRQGEEQGLGADWRESLTGMLRYAASMGWVDEARGTVRGHVTTEPLPTAPLPTAP